MKNKHRSKRRVCFLIAASSGVAARSHFLVPCVSATQFRSDFFNLQVLRSVMRVNYCAFPYSVCFIWRVAF